MKVKKVNILGQETFQIFISQEDAVKSKIQEELERLKEQMENVVVFWSGEVETERALKSMVQIMRDSV